jgi:DNA-binding LacI/PurR family transcriptional regulator
MLMVTVKNLADIAGVSPATVSRVINNASNVSHSIRERVQQAIQDTNYYPNYAARSLIHRRSGSIAVLLRNLHRPFFHDLLKGFENAAYECSRSVFFCNLAEDQEYRNRYLEFLINGISDGVILYGTLFTDRPMIEHIIRVQFPFLLIENNFQDLAVNQIIVNNTGGAQTAVERLIELGHRRIAIFIENLHKQVNIERLNGYMEVMQRHGFPIIQGYIRNFYQDYEAIYQETRAMMARDAKDRPTAVFAINDRIAIQIIKGVISMGYQVPRDLSVVGFDKQRYFGPEYSGPAITSISQPFSEIGRDSIAILIGILEGTVKTPFSRTYETRYEEGETAGPPPVV